MKQMTKELLDALIAVQQELNAPKSQRNTFAGFDYRSCEDIMEAVKPLLKKYHLALTLTDEPVLIGTSVYIRSTATLHGENDSFSVSYAAKEPPEAKAKMDESQTTGSASSYARKYALNGLFAIDDAKDADTDEYQKQQGKAQKGANSRQNAAKAQPKQEPVKPAIVCQTCGKQLMSVQHKGVTYTPEQIAQSTNNKYKRTLCWNCANKLKENA